MLSRHRLPRLIGYMFAYLPGL